MDQNNLNNQAQVPEHPLTTEEMIQTQVLNLEEVQKAAAEEKRKSKKGPILMLVIGIVAILGGVATSFILKDDVKETASGPKQEEQSIEPEQTEDLSTEVPETVATLSCTLGTQAEADGTDKTINYNFTFDDAGLIRYLKSFTVAVSSEDTAGVGPATVQAYGTQYAPFVINGVGYTVTTDVGDTFFTLNTTIDFAVSETPEVPDAHKLVEQTSVDYAKGIQKEELKQTLMSKGYNCTE